MFRDTSGVWDKFEKNLLPHMSEKYRKIFCSTIAWALKIFVNSQTLTCIIHVDLLLSSERCKL